MNLGFYDVDDDGGLVIKPVSGAVVCGHRGLLVMDGAVGSRGKLKPVHSVLLIVLCYYLCGDMIMTTSLT